MLAERTTQLLNRVVETYTEQQALRPETNGCQTGRGCDDCQNRCAGDAATSLGDLEDLIPVVQTSLLGRNPRQVLIAVDRMDNKTHKALLIEKVRDEGRALLQQPVELQAPAEPQAPVQIQLHLEDSAKQKGCCVIH